MKISLQGRERQHILNAAQKFEEKTGEKYSIRFVMLLLSEKYEQRFEKDIDDIFDEKIRLHEEEIARKSIQ